MGGIEFLDGRVGSVVLVGPRNNPKAAVVVVAGEKSGPVTTMPLPDALEMLHPSVLIDILASQERAFGTSGLHPLS